MTIIDDIRSGSFIAIAAFLRNITNKELYQEYFVFVLKRVLPIALTFYIIIGCICFPILPLVIGLIYLTPGFVWAIISAIPIWAFVIASLLAPVSTHRLFLLGIRPLNPDIMPPLFKRLQQGPSRGLARCCTSLCNTILLSFATSILLAIVSFIPIIGLVTASILQTYFAALSLSHTLTTVLIKSAAHLSFKDEKKLFKSHRWIMVGFATPFVLLTSIPVFGTLCLGAAQASVADLYLSQLKHVLPPSQLVDEGKDLTLDVNEMNLKQE